VNIYKRHPDHAADINGRVVRKEITINPANLLRTGALCSKVCDPEDKVRSAAIKVVEKLVDSKDIDAIELISKELLDEIAMRCKDRRVSQKRALQICKRFPLTRFAAGECPPRSRGYDRKIVQFHVPGSVGHACWSSEHDT
jgi:hypothetical protein